MEEYKRYEEDLELYETAMNNAYYLITKKRTLDDIYFELEEGERHTFPLPFNPMQEDGRTEDILDVVIEYFTSTEEYEKCAELVKIKDLCQTNS
tara:strand:- start:8265 stop:8546 length:282 start_codon:yes stop_codon:yes gene_type:complete